MDKLGMGSPMPALGCGAVGCSPPQLLAGLRGGAGGAFWGGRGLLCSSCAVFP